MQKCVEYSARLKRSCTQAKLIITMHVCLIKEFQAISMLYIFFYSYNVGMVRFGRLKAILKGILQKIALHALVVHLKDKRITIGHAHAASHDLLVNRIPKTLQFLVGYLYGARRCIIIVYRKAKLTIWHANSGHTTIKHSPFAGLYLGLCSA